MHVESVPVSGVWGAAYGDAGIGRCNMGRGGGGECGGSKKETHQPWQQAIKCI